MSYMNWTDPRLEEQLDESPFPVVFLNERHPVNAIYIDEVAAGRAITQFLADTRETQWNRA